MSTIYIQFSTFLFPIWRHKCGVTTSITFFKTIIKRKFILIFLLTIILYIKRIIPWRSIFSKTIFISRPGNKRIGISTRKGVFCFTLHIRHSHYHLTITFVISTEYTFKILLQLKSIVTLYIFQVLLGLWQIRFGSFVITNSYFGIP